MQRALQLAGSRLTRLLDSGEAGPGATARWFGADGPVMKRDDLLDLEGNKARKLFALDAVLASLVRQDHPAAVLSWGGNQSNAMLALAQLCHRHGVPLHYLTPSLPLPSSRVPESNWGRACALGMHATVGGHSRARTLVASAAPAHRQPISTELASLLPTVDLSGTTLLTVPQGASGWWSASGTGALVEELEVQLAEVANVASWYILVPAGTGTTALWLHLHAQARGLPWAVLAVPAVGSAAQLQATLLQHLAWLEASRETFAASVAPLVPDFVRQHLPALDMSLVHLRLGWPEPGTLGVLEPPKKYSRLFARCHGDYFGWQATFERVTGIPMDLIYAPKAWLTLEAHIAAGALPAGPAAGSAGLCVLHTGGTSGNAAMRARCLGFQAQH